MTSNSTGSFSAVAYAQPHDDPQVTAAAILSELTPAQRDQVSDVEDRLARAIETIAVHKANGEYSTARLAIHEQIIGRILTEDAIINSSPPDDQPPTLVFLGGRGGSGKSQLRGRVYDPAKAIVVDPDGIKAMLPEYAGWNAFEVHEESSDITEAVLRLVRALRLNLVIDATLKSTAPALSKANLFRRDGYRVEVHYMFLPRQIAARRAVNRFFGQSGRYVRIDVILGNTTNEATFDSLQPLVDAWSFHDNNVDQGQNPKFVEAYP